MCKKENRVANDVNKDSYFGYKNVGHSNVIIGRKKRDTLIYSQPLCSCLSIVDTKRGEGRVRGGSYGGIYLDG